MSHHGYLVVSSSVGLLSKPSLGFLKPSWASESATRLFEAHTEALPPLHASAGLGGAGKLPLPCIPGWHCSCPTHQQFLQLVVS